MDEATLESRGASLREAIRALTLIAALQVVLDAVEIAAPPAARGLSEPWLQVAIGSFD